MFEELKKKSFKSSLPATILLLVIAVIFTVIMSNKFLYAIKGFALFETLTPDEINNQLVYGTVYENWGYFVDEYDGDALKYSYYIIATGDQMVEDYKYLGIKVPKTMVDQMDVMCEAYYNGDDYDTLAFYGEIKKMATDELSYFRDFFADYDLTNAENR